MPKVLVPLAEGCEELEAVTVIDLLRRAGVEVVTAALQPGPVTASRGVVLLPDTLLEEVQEQDFDMLVLPGGGGGARRLSEDPRVAALLKRMAQDAQRWTAAICAAPQVLAGAGLLEGRRVTAYPGALDGTQVDGLTVTGAAVEQDGRLVTSRGPGTAMDFALTLVGLLCGEEQRREVEQGLARTD